MLKNIPTIIIQGRYDLICPPKSAFLLAKNMSNCELKIIENSGHSSKIRAGIVFTGGGARLSGLDEYAEAKFSCPARIGAPANIAGIGNVSGKARYSTAVGLLLYRENKLKDMPHRTSLDNNPLFTFINNFWTKLSAYFHREL